MTDTQKVNKAVRIFAEKQLKFTVAIVLKSGKTFEIQCNDLPKPKFNTESRRVLLCYAGYEENPICDWENVEIILHDKNVEA